MNRLKNLGLYIHIPFCLSKCRYCDFCSFPHPAPDKVNKYISTLKYEIEEYGRRYAEYTVDTVYFGGGTPTLLSSNELTDILNTVKSCFNVTKDAEITAECNPATADSEYFSIMRKAGFNRLSLGVQSMNDGELKILGRLHSSADVKKAFIDARAAGFENVSADVMFGIPDQTLSTLEDTLDEVLRLSPTHVSLYGLKIEDGTHFARHRQELALPDEDTEYEMYLSSVKKLSENGFERYEISNFAKNGFYSRHNLKYWLREDYLGIGISAHSCIWNERFFENNDIENFFGNTYDVSIETISSHDILCEKIMLGMRLEQGVNFELLESEYGKSAEKYKAALEKFIPSGHVVKKADSLCFTDSGMYISNYILSEILDFDA